MSRGDAVSVEAERRWRDNPDPVQSEAPPLETTGLQL